MFGDYTISIIVSFGLVVALVVGFSFPELTGGGMFGSGGEVYEANVAKEKEHCEQNVDDVNCACYAQKSGAVMTYEAPEVFGWNYGDQTELARSQAGAAC